MRLLLLLNLVFASVPEAYSHALLKSFPQTGLISGFVTDRSGDVIANAEILVQDQEAGVRQRLTTDSNGHYLTPELAPGTYRVIVRSAGFRTISQNDLKVLPGQTAHADFVLDILPLQQEVTVSASQSEVDPTATGLTMSRTITGPGLPENGRDVHALLSIMPGATMTPASISSGGQFTVSGQRPNTNSFRVDGISGNVSIGVVSLPGALPGGALPGMSTIGSLQSLASKEETETVDLRSSDFAAEYGDRPGAQVDIHTHAGSNEFHGSLFGYIRPHSLDSQDWFARGAGLSLPSAYLDGWGGGFGGPIWRKRTFFFAAYERADLRDSAVQVIAVPSPAARQNPSLSPYFLLFATFPSPAGRTLNANESLSYSPLQKVGRVSNRSVRLDQILTAHAEAFARYSDVPSLSSNIDLGTAYSSFSWTSVTAGANLSLGQFTHEWRGNYTQTWSTSTHGAEDRPSVDALKNAIQGDFNPPWDITDVSMAGIGGNLSGTAGKGRERQWEANYLFSWHRDIHDLRAGFDYDRLESRSPSNLRALIAIAPSGTESVSFAYTISTLSIVSPSIDSLLAGVPLGLTSSFGAIPQLASQRYSSFAEDTIRLSDAFKLLTGIRWEVTPANFTSGNGPIPATFDVGYWRGVGATSTHLPNGYSLAVPSSAWPLRYNQIAPRLGMAYHIKFLNLTLRSGVGLFYDTGLSSIISNTNPLTIWQYLPTSANPPSPPVAVSYPAKSVLYLPQIWEWKTSLEKSLSERSLLSVSYVGSQGIRLVRNEASIDAPSGALESLQFTSNGKSHYNALLVNFHGELPANIYTLASYTWSHSVDMSSSDTLPVLVNGPSNTGASSFDIRQTLSASLGYRTPNRFGLILGGWTISSSTLARTGFPFDITTVDHRIGLGFDNSDRVNVVANQPLWIQDPSLPGGRTLNPLAFQAPAPGATGTLGRNALTGFGLFQIDASVRRQLRLWRGVSAEAAVSAFNFLNHASFANPVNYLGSALFGQSTSMTNLMLGSGSPTTGLTPLYQAGGPRTVELSLRFSF